MWMWAKDVCCEDVKHDGPCDPPTYECPEPDAEQLIRYAVSLICAATGQPFTGWCQHVDELWHEQRCRQNCGRDCCTQDRIPVGDGMWPVLPGSIGVRIGHPDRGQAIPQSMWHLDQSTHELVWGGGDGWPRCVPLHVWYREVRVPFGGPAVLGRLVCELQKLWRPHTGQCRLPVTQSQVGAGETPQALFTDPFVAAMVLPWASAGPRKALFAQQAGGWTRSRIR
jgi:hypothetical protein